MVAGSFHCDSWRYVSVPEVISGSEQNTLSSRLVRIDPLVRVEVFWGRSQTKWRHHEHLLYFALIHLGPMSWKVTPHTVTENTVLTLLVVTSFIHPGSQLPCKPTQNPINCVHVEIRSAWTAKSKHVNCCYFKIFTQLLEHWKHANRWATINRKD